MSLPRSNNLHSLDPRYTQHSRCNTLHHHLYKQQMCLTLIVPLVQLLVPLPSRTDFGSHWRKPKSSRTLPVEIVWKTRCCVVNPKECPFNRMVTTSANCCSSHTLASNETWPLSPHHLISWLHGACAGQELQEAIKKLEEEVPERALPGHRDVVETCSNLMPMGEWLCTSNFNCWAQKKPKNILKLVTGIISWYPWLGNAPVRRLWRHFPVCVVGRRKFRRQGKTRRKRRWKTMEKWFPRWCLHAWWYRCGLNPTQITDGKMNLHFEFHLLNTKNTGKHAQMEECTSTTLSIAQQQICSILMGQLVQLVLSFPNRTYFASHPVEIAWKTRCCVVYGKPQFSGSRRMSFFTKWEQRQQLVARIGFKSNWTIQMWLNHVEIWHKWKDGAAGAARSSTSKQDRFRKSKGERRQNLRTLIACWDCLENKAFFRIR